MTHSAERIRQALTLHANGASATAIAREVGVPRRTVSDWLRGSVPTTASELIDRCDRCGHRKHLFDRLPEIYVYLLGLYLGDGSMSSHPRGVFKLRLNLDSTYPGILREAADAMATVMPASRVNNWERPYGDVEIYSYSKSWPCLIPQHAPGKKHERVIALRPWQRKLVWSTPRLFLRGLIHSDGCRFLNTGRRWRHPRYSFRNASSDIRALFCEACDMLDIRWTSSSQTVYVSRTADVAHLDAFIGPKE